MLAEKLCAAMACATASRRSGGKFIQASWWRASWAERVEAWLLGRGRKVRRVREPGGTALGDRIRAVLLDAAGSPVAPEAELLLFEACRAQLVTDVIAPALAAGEVVLSDRYSDSTTAYQSHARGFDPALVATLNRFASRALEPDLTILLDLPVAAGLGRAHERATPGEDRFEAESVAFHERVRTGFLAVAEAAPSRVRVVGADAPLGEVTEAITAILTSAGL